MPYNSVISSTDLASLIPPEYANEIINGAIEQSAVLRLARRLRDMPSNTTTEPVLASLPIAYFVNGARGLKSTTNVTWGDITITAEEIAVIVPIEQAALDDSGYPIWDTVKPLCQEAAGVAIDQAVLYGTNIPAAWTASFGTHAGIVAFALAHGSNLSLAAKTDLYEALMDVGGLLALLEADGYMATGHICHTTMAALLRGCRDKNGNPIFVDTGNIGNTIATGTISGVPALYPLNGAIDSSAAYDIVGQWNQLVYKMRQDISWKIATEASIHDGSGNLVYNLFQQDMVALRMTMRLGFALPNPINRMNQTAGTRSPFAYLTA